MKMAMAVLVACAVMTQTTTVPKGYEQFQGTWVVTATSGDPVPAGAQVSFVVEGNKYKGFVNGTNNETGTFTLGAAGKVTPIDLAITEGSSAGKPQLGIIEISGNTVRMALAEPGVTIRPGAFEGDNVLTLTKVGPLAKELLGSWEGAITVPTGQTLRLAMKLSNGADGVPSGTFVSLDQGATDIPIAAGVQSGAKVTIISPGIRATFKGEVKGDEIVGTFSQGPANLPLTFKRK